jgi:hypothetical protein
LVASACAHEYLPQFRYARGKTLKQDALKKNKIDSKDAIVHLLQDGKGIMTP